MTAYRLETSLVELISPLYSRSENDGRDLFRSMMKLNSDLKISGNNLEAALEPMHYPQRREILKRLCELSKVFPGAYPSSKLKLSFSVRET